MFPFFSVDVMTIYWLMPNAKAFSVSLFPYSIYIHIYIQSAYVYKVVEQYSNLKFKLC